MLLRRNHALLAGLLLTVALLMVVASLVNGDLGGQPEPGETGAPDEGTCYSSSPACHTHSNTGDRTDDGLTIAFTRDDVPVDEYKPGLNVTLTVNVTADSNDFGNHGFEVTVLDSFDEAVGNFTITDTTNLNLTTDQTSNLRDYVRNRPAGQLGIKYREWQFNWTASDYHGDVSFYVTALSSANLTQPEWTDITWVRTFDLAQINRPPTISFPNVLPPSVEVNASHTLTYEVLYRDLDDDAPLFVNLSINGNDPVTMSKEEGCEDYSLSGCIYLYETDGTDARLNIGAASANSFVFNASDGDWAKGNGTLPSYGPKVNTPPVLSQAAVAPAFGTATTPFNLTVVYSDANWQAGSDPGYAPGAVWAQVAGGANLTLARQGGGAGVLTDGNYTNGELFYVESVLPPDGTVNLTFGAHDNLDTAATSDAANASAWVNDRPVLSDAALSATSVGESEAVNVTVVYTDANNHTGTVTAVFAGASSNGSVSLARVGGDGCANAGYCDGDYTNGELFYWDSTRPWDLYGVWFSATDGLNASANTTLFALTVNDAPTLADGGVTNVTGSVGGQATNFTFYVTYSDPNVGQTATVTVTIAGQGTFDMSDTGGGNYTYTAVGLPWGYRNFSFAASDQFGAAATGEPDAHGLLVNDAPTVGGANVTPTIDSLAATYTFNATVTDINADQDLTVWLLVTGQAPRAMTTTGDPTAGANYLVAVAGSDLGGGSHNFTVRVDDSWANATSALVEGPTVNYAPGLSDPGMTPAEGWTDGINGTRFNFTLTYTDGDATAEPWVGFELNGTLYSMNWTGDGNLTAGRTYYREIDAAMFGPGNFAYTFYANDTVDNTTLAGGSFFVATAPVDLVLKAVAYYRADGEPVGPGTDKRPVQNENTTIVVTVANVGGLNASSFDLRLVLGATTYWRTLGLDAGGETTVTLGHIFTVAGNVSANYTADPTWTFDEGGRTANNTLAHTVMVLAQASGQPLALAGNFTFIVDGSLLTDATLRIFNTTANQTLAVNGNYTYLLNDGTNLTFNEGDTITLTGWWIDGFNNNHTSSVSFVAYSEDNISYHYFVLGRTYGANLTDTIAPATGDPGEVLAFAVVLNNTGNVFNDTFNLSVVTGLGWEVKWLRDDIEVENVTLDAEENVTLTVEVTVAAAALADDLETVTLTVTSQGDATASDTLVIVITANQVGGVIIAPATNSSSAVRESVITYYFEITNTGNGVDNFTLAWQAEDSDNWTVEPSAAWVALARGESTTVWASVTVPDLYNATSDTLTLTVTSLYNFTLTSDRANASAAATSTVSPILGVAVREQQADYNGAPGEVVNIIFDVSNLGNANDTYLFTVTGLNVPWSYGPVAPVTISYYSQDSVVVMVTVPHVLAGSVVQVTLTATSENWSVSDSATVELTVDQSYGVTVTAPEGVEGVPGDDVAYLFLVTNDGNGDDIFDLAVDQVGWSAAVSPGNVTLARGASKLVKVTHTLPAAADVAYGRNDTVTLTATSRGDGTSGNDTTTTTAGLYRDVTLDGWSVSATIYPEESLYPGGSLDLILNVTNKGNGDQTVTLAVSRSAAGWASLVASVDLNGYDDVAHPVLTVTIPEDRPAGSSATLTVTASVADISRTRTYTFTMADPSRDLDLSFPELTANTIRLNPGTSGLANLEVENTGHVRTAYRLLLLGDVTSDGEVVEGVQVGFSNSALTVSQGENGTAEIALALPVDWTGTADIRATFLVYAVVDTSVQETVVLTLRPNQPLDTGGWELERDPLIEAGDAHTYTLTGVPAGDYDYAWEFDDGTSIAAGSASESHTFDTAGNHTVTITVTDDLGQTTLFTALVSVGNRAPVVVTPVVTGGDEPTAEGEYIEDSTIAFSLDLSGITDSDGSLILLEVNFGDGTKVAYTGAELANLMASGDKLYVDHIYANPGEYSVQVRVVDNLGEESNSHIQTVIVKERLNMLTGLPALLYGATLLVTLGLGMILVVAAWTIRRNYPAATPVGPEIAAGLSDEDRDRLDRMENRVERLVEREELMEVSAYDASRVTARLEGHLQAFRKILGRAQELAAQERLAQLEREIEEQQTEEEDAELDRLEPDLESLAERFHDTLSRLVATREELSTIEDQLAHILIVERDEQAEKLAELTEAYETTQRKIQALEGLQRSREAAKDETTIRDLLGSTEPLRYEEEPAYEADEEAHDEEYDDYGGDEDDEEEDDEEEEEEMAECGSCGALIPADALECPECGIAFDEEYEEEE